VCVGCCCEGVDGVGCCSIPVSTQKKESAGATTAIFY